MSAWRAASISASEELVAKEEPSEYSKVMLALAVVGAAVDGVSSDDDGLDDSSPELEELPLLAGEVGVSPPEDEEEELPLLAGELGVSPPEDEELLPPSLLDELLFPEEELLVAHARLAKTKSNKDLSCILPLI